MTYEFSRLDPDFKKYIDAIQDAALLLGRKVPKAKGSAEYVNPDALGLDLYPVIPAALPVDQFHKRKRNAHS